MGVGTVRSEVVMQMDSVLVFILFIMYIWPTQLPRLGLAGEPFSISQLGSERSLALFASLILLF